MRMDNRITVCILSRRRSSSSLSLSLPLLRRKEEIEAVCGYVCRDDCMKDRRYDLGTSVRPRCESCTMQFCFAMSIWWSFDTYHIVRVIRVIGSSLLILPLTCHRVLVQYFLAEWIEQPHPKRPANWMVAIQLYTASSLASSLAVLLQYILSLQTLLADEAPSSQE